MKHQWSDKIQVCYKTIAHCHLISFYIKDFFFTGTCVHVTGTINQVVLGQPTTMDKTVLLLDSPQRVGNLRQKLLK